MQNIRFASARSPSVVLCPPRTMTISGTTIEGLSGRRLARSIGVSHSTVSRWKHGSRPSKTSEILLKLIRRHGLNAVLSGDLTQSVENQGNKAMQGSDKAK